MPEEFNMTVLYAIGGVLSLGLLIYLFVALLKPEAFS
jgi:K+-transporting ATPase KdpF subunit